MPFRKDTLHFIIMSKIYQACQGKNEGHFKNWNFYQFMSFIIDVGLSLRAKQSFGLCTVKRDLLRVLFSNIANQPSE